MKPHISAETIRGIPLFATMTRSQLEAIAQAADRQHVERNGIIIREDDDSSRGVYFILEGESKVVVSGPDGREATLALLTEGDFFGEMSLLDGDTRSATVKTTSDSDLVVIRRDPFLNLLREYPEIGVAMLAELSSRLRQANRRISALALMPVNGRVAGAILQLLETRGVKVRGQTILRDRPTQQEIADMACTTRETVSRVLGQLVKDHILALEGRDLVVLDEERLRGEA